MFVPLKKTDMSPNASINSRLEPRDNFFVLDLPSSISSYPFAIFFRVEVAFFQDSTLQP